MPPEELQRQSAEERAKTLLKRTRDRKRSNSHMMNVALNAMGVLIREPFDADLCYGTARALSDPAHREMLRTLGRDEQAEAVKRTLLVEVPGPGRRGRGRRLDDEAGVAAAYLR